MRTGRSLTVCRSLLPGVYLVPGGGYLVPGGLISPSGVLSPGGLVPGGGVWSQGGLVPGGRGKGGSDPRGSQQYPSMH